MSTPETIATAFIAHFLDVPTEEVPDLEITRALGELIRQVAMETAEVLNEEERTLH